MKGADMIQKLRNIYELGVKELIGLFRDPLMLALIVYSFTFAIYVGAVSSSDSVTNAAVAVVDQDRSSISQRIMESFLPPQFRLPVQIEQYQIDGCMDRGEYTFILVIPPDFQRDLLAGKGPSIQLNVDATRMSQAFVGAGYVQQIVLKECNTFFAAGSSAGEGISPANIVIRNRFNPNLESSWFGGINQLINNITMLAIILTGASLIRERERGTLEHLMVMPVTSFETMVSKIWSMSLAVLIASAFALLVIIKWYLGIPVTGSFWLFMLGVTLYLFAVTSLGIFIACFAGNMPQFGILMILILIPMQMLSGGSTPQESMPVPVQRIMQLSPTTHFVTFSQAILFRGAGMRVVWVPFLKLFVIGAVLFIISLKRFRKTAAA